MMTADALLHVRRLTARPTPYQHDLTLYQDDRRFRFDIIRHLNQQLREETKSVLLENIFCS